MHGSDPIGDLRRLDALESLERELAEALERHAATSAILRVIAGMPEDVQPVFDAIVAAGVRLFRGALVAISRQRGGMVHVLAIAEDDPERAARWRDVFPFPLSREYIHGAAILDCRVVDVADVLETGGRFEAGKRNMAPSGYRAVTVVPLVRDAEAIGAIAVVRRAPGALSGRQIELLESFADQAVIAIENVRLVNALQVKTRELEIAGRHRSAFLATMSHELRTPLNAILGFTRIVLRETRGTIPPRQSVNLEKILASARHLIGLINATLDLTRIEAGRIEITPSEVALAPLLDECLRSVEPLRADGVRLGTRLPAALPTMRVDAGKLHQILLNVLGNAVKFTDRGHVELRAAAHGERVTIEVEDTGIGIPADKLEAVFEEFEQVDESHSRAFGGTGLGLAIARRLARAMGGELSARSAPGEGSTFTLDLPLRWKGADDA
jgi:signal transduction histidine kinase